MRGRTDGVSEATQWAHIPGVQMRDGTVGRPLGMEYDGLDTGELAWIMGRNSDMEGTGTYITRSAHSGMGFGVDRMQRLASQFYMENYFRARFGETVINLVNINLGAEPLKNSSNELKMYGNFLAGATALGSVDLPHLVNGLFRTNNPAAQQLTYTADIGDAAINAPAVRGGGTKEGFASGLLVIEKGPFLRGKINDVSAVEMLAPELAYTLVGGARKHTVARNLGDRVAFDALYATMRMQGMFDWTPDGLILSKLESPSGEPLSSAELDARQAQLFNVAIQGPAITKTWTGNPAMQAMPLDKVFVVIVADISTTVSNTATDGYGSVAELKGLWEEYRKFVTGTDGGATADAVAGQMTASNRAFDNNKAGDNGPYADAVKRFFSKSKELSVNSDPSKKSTLRGEVTTAKTAMDEFFGSVTNTEIDDFSTELKQGSKGVGNSAMTNFRLMRMTSSFLINNSAAVFAENSGELKGGRCGLKLGKKDADTVTGEYIVGGWCVGSVLDSAASRSVIGSQVRTAPASMAMNVNVNVEWWSGDDLYRRYMDVDGTVQQRGVMTDVDTQAKRTAGTDVAAAARKEGVGGRSFLDF